MEIREVKLVDVKCEILRERLERAKSGRTVEYVVIINDAEVAALSYEDWSEKSLGFIYEIFLLKQYRNKGLGSKILEFAEKKAIELKCQKIELDAHSLDEHTEQNWLFSWYEKKGYTREKSSERMYKTFE